MARCSSTMASRSDSNSE
uniref:Uncharacterized protein n=1 Tax=Arundo donax TaxID=35708 RepID=A0A0A9GQT1_ARUDO